MNRPPTVPVAPLLAWLHASGRGAAGAGEAVRRAYQRARKDGQLSVHAADTLAIRLLGVHPIAVWGDAYLADVVGYYDEPDEFGNLPQPIVCVRGVA